MAKAQRSIASGIPASEDRIRARDIPCLSPLEPVLFDAGSVIEKGPFQKGDYRYWAKMAIWNAIEIACITCGFDPAALGNATEEQCKMYPETLYVVNRRYELVTREFEFRNYAPVMAPMDVLGMLDGLEEPYPPELREVAMRIAKNRTSATVDAPKATLETLVRQIDGLTANTSTEANTSNQAGMTKRYRTLQKVALVMAAKFLDFDPRRAKNTAAADISRASETYLGLRVSEDAVLAHLREAANEHGLESLE